MEWINAKEKMPDTTGRYLCYGTDGYVEIIYYIYNPERPTFETRTYHRHGTVGFTHWMHLPTPPSE